MKCLCLAYYDEEAFEAIPGAELKASGHLEMVASLASPKYSTCLRPRAGKITIADGPYAETREALGSFFLIEACQAIARAGGS